MASDRYHTFWPRLVALIIDGIIVSTTIRLLGFFFAEANLEESTINNTAFILKNNLPYLYAIFMVGQFGQTIGKMIMKIKIVDYLTEEPIGIEQSFKREAIPFLLVNVSIFSWFFIFSDIDIRNNELSTFGWLVLFLPSIMLFVWSGLEIITMLTDNKKRALHDKIADTVVVNQ